MKRNLILALIAIVIVACGEGPNTVQLGKATLASSQKTDYEGPSFGGKTEVSANEAFELVRLGDEQNTASAPGSYTLDFVNTELDVKETYKAADKVRFWVDEEGLRGLMKIESEADAKDAGTKPYVCRLSISVVGSDQSVLSGGEMLADRAVYVSSDGGADLDVTTGTNVTMKIACDPEVADGDPFDADHPAKFAGALSGNCEVRPTRIETYTEDANGNQSLSWKVNSECDVIAVGEDITFLGGNNGGGGGGGGGGTCQDTGTCTEPTRVCSGNVCYVSYDTVTITDYTGDVATLPATTIELNGVNQGNASLVNDTARAAGQVAQYSVASDGTGRGHWLGMFLWDMGNLTIGSQQSKSFCLFSSVAQTLNVEAVEKSATHQFANAGVWLEVTLTANQYTCKTVTFTVRGDPTKVPTSVTSLTNVKWATYFGNSKVATIKLDQ